MEKSVLINDINRLMTVDNKICFAPRAIDALKNAFLYVSQNDEALFSISYGIQKGYRFGLFPVKDIEPFIPKVYRYPGYILYHIYDKEYVLKGDYQPNNWQIWGNMMKDDDFLIRLNKIPNVCFIFPQAVLPIRFKQAISIRRSGCKYEDLSSCIPDPETLIQILYAEKGYQKEAALLLKKLGIKEL